MIFNETSLFLTTNSTIWYMHWSILSSSSNTRIFVCSIFFTIDAIYFCHFYLVHSTAFLWLLTSSFILLYSINALFTEQNSSWLIYESLKPLEIKTSIVFNLVFANNTTLLWAFLLFLIIDLYFLIPAAIAQIFIPTTGLVIPTGTLTKEANLQI